jgi:2-amino-4-hydroxy-6-hydroxymethyldihydropteridine diphosphokinase
LTLPHAQLLSRRFVLIPALELDFDATVPDGRRLSDALAALPLEEGVRWAGPPLELPGSDRAS